MTKREVLTPESPRWELFIEKLDAAIGEDGCAAGTNKDHAIFIMRAMGGIDIQGTISYFEDHGGFCDCEIILNVCTGDEKCLNDGPDIEMSDEEYRRLMGLH